MMNVSLKILILLRLLPIIKLMSYVYKKLYNNISFKKLHCMFHFIKYAINNSRSQLYKTKGLIKCIALNDNINKAYINGYE